MEDTSTEYKWLWQFYKVSKHYLNRFILHQFFSFQVSESKARKSVKSSTPSKNKNIVDPLNLSTGFDGTDPLSQFAAQSDLLSQMARQMSLDEKVLSDTAILSTGSIFWPMFVTSKNFINKFLTDRKRKT
jgi:hypothetical protein